MTQHANDPARCAEAIVDRVGREIRLAVPIGIGKPVLLVNALCKLAEADRSIKLHIFTGLSLARPRYRTSLEERFAKPLLDRLFASYPDLVYTKALQAGTLPPNIEVTEFFLQAGAWLVSASVRGEVPLAVIRAIKESGALVGADVQGYVRVVGEDGRLHYTPWPEQAAVLALVDVLKTDAVEAEFLTGTADIHRAAAILASQGPREIVLTHRDGMLVLADGKEHEATFHPEPLRGRSGRGDTCIGSYLSRRLSSSPAEATIWAAAVTSLKMEAEGPIRRPVADVHALIERKYGAD